MLDVDLAEASDIEIWKHAGRDDSVIVSKDEDFLYLSNAHSTVARFIWIRLGNCRTKALPETIGILWPKIEEALNAAPSCVVGSPRSYAGRIRPCLASPSFWVASSFAFLWSDPDAIVLSARNTLSPLAS